MTCGGWSVESSTSKLGGAEVHVWRASLDSPIDDIEQLYPLLSDDERLKADRFHFALHRRRYIRAHATLRRLLGAYLDPGGGDWRLGTGDWGLGSHYAGTFIAGPNGKPRLEGSGPRFNLSHAGALGLFAFARGREVGVDLEVVNPAVEVDSIAQRFFSEPERSSLFALAAHRRVEGFYHIWSQKEAYLKARGDGVVHGLDHFDVVAEPDRPAGLLADRRDPLATSRWMLFTLEPGPEFRSALGVEGGGPIALRQFECRERSLR